MEFSSLKLFRDNPDLMEEYDIRDEYELHNLLKKIWPETSELKIQFKKMPTIVIGEPDRDQQVLGLLMQYAPISNVELAKKYEEQYGTAGTPPWEICFPVSTSFSTTGSTALTIRSCRRTSISA